MARKLNPVPAAPVPTRTFSVAAIDAEAGRRRNNKKRDEKARAKSFVLAGMSADQMAAVKGGEVIEVAFKSGRVETVGLKAAA